MHRLLSATAALAVMASWLAGASAAPSGTIERRGDELFIAVDKMPLAEAATQLARVTAPEWHDAALLPAGSVTLHWQGRDADAAWRLLFAGRVSYGSRCMALRCRLWLATPANGAGAPLAAARPAPAARPGSARPAPIRAAPAEAADPQNALQARRALSR